MLLPPDSSQQHAKQASRTDWIDGLRGLASLSVCLSHVLGGAYPSLYFAYGDGPPGRLSRSWLKLPIIRLLHSGDAAVALFFLASGYALSLRPLRLIQQQSPTSPLESLSSSVLRRTGRLLIPTLAASLATCLAAQFGAFDTAQATLRHQTHHPSYQVFFFVSAKRQSSLLAQMALWHQETMTLFFFNRGDTLTVPVLRYGTHLWTIPVELWASLVVYLFLLGLVSVPRTARCCIIGMSCRTWGGVAATDIGEGKEKEVEVEMEMEMERWGSPTVNAAAAPGGWTALNRLAPVGVYGEENAGRFWVAIGAVCIFFSVQRWPLLQGLLGIALPRWLGRVSFSLYLVHNAIMSSLGAWLIAIWGNGNGQEDVGIGGDALMVCILCLVVAVSIGVANVFYRVVDEPSKRFMVWLELRLERPTSFS
ncbi:hypothetical protein QBC34DRAFT_470275 [Podospora aff. communis PSN243]|uniref:Acyltransferase 3 domain-containing protein n=1 Tax=Podospora aff. communis PSN243 TaxID=3040156 RepID=A0AAV9GFU5_9PEZI|nr:hypothetical protein QBC34DRAFT_470275 [Podospora aff. communis PSN243]